MDAASAGRAVRRRSDARQQVGAWLASPERSQPDIARAGLRLRHRVVLHARAGAGGVTRGSQGSAWHVLDSPARQGSARHVSPGMAGQGWVWRGVSGSGAVGRGSRGPSRRGAEGPGWARQRLAVMAPLGWAGRGRFGLAWRGMAGQGLAWPCLARLGSFGAAGQGAARQSRFGMSRPVRAGHVSAWHGTHTPQLHTENLSDNH